jgi:hypothetical protein
LTWGSSIWGCGCDWPIIWLRRDKVCLCCGEVPLWREYGAGEGEELAGCNIKPPPPPDCCWAGGGDCCCCGWCKCVRGGGCCCCTCGGA